MKHTKDVFSGLSSAVLILLGFAMPSFVGAIGTCDPTQYECKDLDGYDDTHPSAGSVKPSIIHSQEIPNTGIIPSNSRGSHLGDIIYGGRATASTGVGSRTKNDFYPPYGNRINPGDVAKYEIGGANDPDIDENSDNGKKQLIHFNNLNPLDPTDQQNGIGTRFGGHGTYVYGDFVTTGKEIINPQANTMYTPIGSHSYITEGGSKFGFNSSKSKIALPKGITTNDIVYARLYWFGSITGHLDEKRRGLDEGQCTAAEKNEKSSDTCWRLPYETKIPDIEGYQDVKLGIKSKSSTGDYGSKEVPIFDITRSTCQGTYAYNSSRADVTTYKNGDWGYRGGNKATNQQYAMNYVCSADITDKVISQFMKYDDEIEFVVGSINTTEKNTMGQGDNVWGRGSVKKKGVSDINNGWLYSTTYRGPHGGWYVVLVYDKTPASQAILMGKDFPDKDIYGNDIPDNIKYAEARDGAKITGDVKEYIERHYKPKNVTIYDGYLALEPGLTSDGLTEEETEMKINFDISGFFTPKSGDVQGKVAFASYASSRIDAVTDFAGIFIGKDRSKSLTRIKPNDYNENGVGGFFNGSRSYLELGDDGKFKSKGDSLYHQGFDLDEFDISEYLENKQESMSLTLQLKPHAENGTNRAFVPMVAVSVDIYVPKLCYEQKMYDTVGWLGFYDPDGTPKDNPGEVEDVHVVTGENLYYRTEIRNRDDDDNEDAEGVWVQVDTGRSNTYVMNSSGINNVPSKDGYPGLDKTKFVFLQDNTPGAYSTQAKRANGGTPDVTDPVYKDRQLNSVINRQPKFYVGKNAGLATATEPTGGELKKGESIYLEFNATVGRTFTYTPIRYTVGYSMKLAGSEEAIQGPTTVMDRCETVEQEVKISLLNGLKIVNQNFKDYGESDSDKNKTLAQDDRLYTQVAELPFDVNMIFKPDINDVFRDYCVSKDAEGKCNYQADNFDICENYAGIFVKENGVCRARIYQKLPDGTWGIFYKKGELDGSLQKFPLPGNLYLSAIRSGSGCRYIEDKDKLPFNIDGKRYMTNYDTGFGNYQTKNNKKVMPIKKVEFEDAFDGVTFMFSYYPRGLNSPDTNTTMFVEDLNNTTFSDGLDENATMEDKMAEYYIYLQTQILYEKYIKGYKRTLPEDQRQALIKAWYEATDEKTLEDRRNFQAELDSVIIEIRTAKTFFGAEMSPDGSFHVCDSDSFVIRPAYFEADLDAATKYAKLVVPTNSDEKVDITEAVKIKHEHNYRVGGDYTENTDVLGHMFYALSNENHPVPNYNAVIGGDLGTNKFRIRNSYSINSLSVDKNNSMSYTAFREIKTYLRPFISNSCYDSIENQAYYIEKDLKKQTNLRSTLGTCANDPTPYNGFKFENGEYVLDDDKINTYFLKDATDKTRDLFGKYTDSCKINSKVFDEEYTKVWDKTAISLIADFGLKKVDIVDGAANLSRFSPNELVAQGLLEPQHKDKIAASLYTGTLFKDRDANDPKGKIFNYYNVGDVLVSVYDNSWTDAHGDQTFDERKDADGEYWGTTCVLNSTSNKHNDKGMVGCDVGMKDNEYVVLRYRPDTIEVAIAGLYDTVRYTKDENGTVYDAVYDNRRAVGGGAVTYTYYNQPDIATPIYDGNINQALLNEEQLKNLAQLNISADAYISNKLYPNIIATLYDGKKDSDTNTSKCGFASELTLSIGFNYDCNANPTDTRCAQGFDSNLTNYTAEKTYYPFAHRRFAKDDVLDKFEIKIPSGTSYFPYSQSNDVCAINSSGTTSNGFDSRCFRINVRANNSEIASGTIGGDYQVSIPMKDGINLYSDITEKSGLLNMMDGVSGFYNPKRDPFKILTTAFDQGRTIHHVESGFSLRASKIYVNFDRMHKTPQMPAIIYVSDFSTWGLKDENKTITPASFNFSYDMLKDIHEDTFNDSLNLTTIDDFTNYQNKVERDYNATVAANIGTSAYFVYGKANEISDGRTTYIQTVGKTLSINVLSMVYCGRDDNCVLLPSNIYAPTTSLFSSFNGAASGGFFVNQLDNFSSTSIGDYFVKSYKTEVKGIPQTRQNATVNGIENTTYNCQQAVNTKVRVLTHPWLVFTPANSNTRIFIDSDTGYDGGLPQYYNYHNIRCITQGTWGGHGKRKSDGDIVGNFVVMDEDLKTTTSTKKDEKSDVEISNNRMDW